MVTQESTTDADAAKVNVNAKSDAPDASNASKIDTPKINVKIMIVKPCAISIILSRQVSLRYLALNDAQSDGKGADTGKFDAKKEAKREATKSDIKQKSDTISTSRRLSLRQEALRETHNYCVGAGEDSCTGGKDTKHSIRVGEGSGKDMRQAIACAVAILCKEKGVIIRGIKVGR